jgi:hypothetical protein
MRLHTGTRRSERPWLALRTLRTLSTIGSWPRRPVIHLSHPFHFAEFSPPPASPRQRASQQSRSPSTRPLAPAIRFASAIRFARPSSGPIWHHCESRVLQLCLAVCHDGRKAISYRFGTLAPDRRLTALVFQFVFAVLGPPAFVPTSIYSFPTSTVLFRPSIWPSISARGRRQSLESISYSSYTSHDLSKPVFRRRGDAHMGSKSGQRRTEASLQRPRFSCDNDRVTAARSSAAGLRVG